MNQAEEGNVRGPVPTRVARAIAPEPAAMPMVHGKDGVRLTIGDRWPEDVQDMGLVVTVNTIGGALNVTLALRADDLRKRDWAAREPEPIVIGLLPMPPVAVFALAFDDGYARGAYSIGEDPADAAAVRQLALDPKAEKTLAFVGIGRGRIRSIKVGVDLERIWDLLAEAFAGCPLVSDDDAYHAALGQVSLPPKVVFMSAMATYFVQDRGRPPART